MWFKSKQKQEALAEIKELIAKADAGDAEAQCLLGIRYYQGDGVEKDIDKAVKWYRLSAAQGYARAQRNLGHRYCLGEGVQQDYLEAIRWYKLAAEQKDSAAMAELGTMYSEGVGVPRDYQEAFRWLKLGAELDEFKAMLQLMYAYYEGLGTEVDKKEACYWAYKSVVKKGTDNMKIALANSEDKALFKKLKQEEEPLRSLMERMFLELSTEDRDEVMARVDPQKKEPSTM